MANSLIHHGSFEAIEQNKGQRILWGNGTQVVLDKFSANHQKITGGTITLPDATTIDKGWFVKIHLTTAGNIKYGDGTTIAITYTTSVFVTATCLDNSSINGAWDIEMGVSKEHFSLTNILNQGSVTTGSSSANDVGATSEFHYPLPADLSISGLTAYTAFLSFYYKTNNAGRSLNLVVYNVTTSTILSTTTVTPASADTLYFATSANFVITPQNLYKLQIYGSGAVGNVTINNTQLIGLAT